MTQDPFALPQDPHWFAVRCLFEKGWLPGDEEESVYEERITLWRAASVEEAVARAEAEAQTYAAAIPEEPDRYLGLAQAFALGDGPRDGVEVFSLLRASRLPAEEYLDAFFDTGSERLRTL